MRGGPRRSGLLLDLFACFLIPAYTLLFAGSRAWFSTNFSVIAVTGPDHYRGFLYWGVLAGGYFFLMLMKLASILRSRVAQTAAILLTLAACLSLCYALAIPYLPEQFPRYADLHVILAALACVLLMLALLVALLALYRRQPDRYVPLLRAWFIIVGICGVLFLIPRWSPRRWRCFSPSPPPCSSAIYPSTLMARYNTIFPTIIPPLPLLYPMGKKSAR